MTIADQRYAVLDRLEELCGFRDEPKDETNFTWKCGVDGDRFAYAKQAIAEVSPGMALEELKGGDPDRPGLASCDCEIVLNCDDRPADGRGSGGGLMAAPAVATSDPMAFVRRSYP